MSNNRELSAAAKRVTDLILNQACYLKHWQSYLAFGFADEYQLISYSASTKLEIVPDYIVYELKAAGLLELAFVEVGYRVNGDEYFKRYPGEPKAE